MKASAAIKAALRGHEPSEEQWSAITHPAIPVVIIAGAGSGKTAIMAARMVWMVEEGIAAPTQILALTFTNKAAGELEERILGAFAEFEQRIDDGPNVATYNSFADRLVREHGVRIGIDPEVGLLSGGQSWQLMKAAVDKAGPFDYIASRSIASVCKAALSLSDQCDNHLVSPEQVAAAERRVLDQGDYFGEEAVQASQKRIELTRLVRAYMDEKTRARRIDYGDQVCKGVEILERFDEVANAVRQQYPAILLDEYQDTNVAQRRMLTRLGPAGSNITAVGDARQNIFQWRGSTLFNLIDFPKVHFLREGGQPHDYLSLSRNFRSGSRILQVANALIEPVPPERRPGEPLQAMAENHEGFVGVKVLPDQLQEARFIVEEIQRLHGSAAHPGRSPIQWRDFAILVRRKSHMDQILAELRAAEIPVEVLGLGGLLDLPEVLDTVAWLRVVADPGPSSNRWLARILMGPRCRIHYRDLAVLARWATKNTIQLAEAKRSGLPAVSVIEDETQLEPDDVAFSLAEALDHLDEIEGLPPQAKLRLAAVRDELVELASVSDGPLVELVQAVISRCGIGHALAASPRRDAAASQSNLTQFVGLVADFAPVAGEASLAEFLDYLDASEDADDSLELHVPSAEDSVKLTTVHRAKGLEFEVVFVPGVAARTNEKGQIVDSIFPDERTSNPATSFNQLPFGVREDRGHLPQPFSLDASGNRRPKKKIDFHEELKQRAVEDERRLFYVALTRAKQILYVTSAWWYERQNKQRGPSVFLTEVRAQPATTDLGESEMPAESPLMASLTAKAIWPPPAHPASIGDEFPEGYAAALDELKAGRLKPDDLLDRLSEADRREARLLLAGHRKALAALTAPEIGAADGSDVQTRTSLSATQAAAAAKEPSLGSAPQKGMPSPPSSARRIGVEIHRWIEEQGRGLTGLADEAALDEAGRSVEPDRLKDLRNAFLEMGYGDRSPARLDTGEPMTELPFVLKLGTTLIKGRIDVVYVDDAGGLEIVDFKSGAKVAADEMDQLMIYAAALDKLGISFGPSIKVTYCYLETRETITRELDTQAVRRGLVQLEQHLAAANPV